MGSTSISETNIMPATDRRLVLLDTRYPNISRMTRWRIEREPGFPAPVIIRNRKYYDSSELAEWEESRRRLGKVIRDAIGRQAAVSMGSR
jgi:hypothetical protein